MRPWLVAPLLIALLAGCSDAPDATTPPEDVDVITDPRDTSYLQNGSMAAGSHIHDYWGGRTSVTVLDDSWSGSRWSCGGCDDGMVFAERRPDEGIIVPQGTKWVNGSFTISDDPNNAFDRLELWVKTAQDVEMRRWGPLESGVPFSIESSQELNDPPHYVLSLWQFSVRAFGGDQISGGGDMAWSVEAVRGLPLVPYPPHPDRWGANTELDLLQDTGGTVYTYQLDIPTFGNTINCNGGCPGRHSLPSGTVIPFDTDRVVVEVTISSGAPAGLGLWFHGADTWAETKATGVTGAPGTTTYTIPIEGSMADSPYAPQSLWEFQIWMDQPQANPQVWSGEYTISVTAYKDP